ncbi:MAG TPA: PRD domain-containing protein [Anaerolineales bacterium]
MAALTTRQRDILRILLEASTPLGAAEIATRMSISTRQVNYSLVGVKSWLAQREIPLKVTPGVGVALECSSEQTHTLQREVVSKSRLQLILTPGQRQQQLALLLLSRSDDPILVQYLQHLLQVARATVLKDLDEVGRWLADWRIRLVRKPNFGVMVTGRELVLQQALAALVWAETPFSDPLVEMTYADGPVFALKADTDLLPIVAQANQILERLNTQRVLGQVAYAEERLGGRFTDDAVLHLSLTLAILADRVHSGRHLEVDDETIDGATLAWLKALPVWQVARTIAKRLGWSPESAWREADVAGITMQILAAPHSEIWPGDLDRDQRDSLLINQLVEHICQAYNQPGLAEDRTLRDGLVNHVIPACLRQRFHLWYPSRLNGANLPEQYEFENKVAADLALIVKDQTQLDLPASEVNNLAMLLRAATIRNRRNPSRRVTVICPSGMATAQLLVARLEARFPRLGSFNVISLRELNQATVANTDLILTTVPLPQHLVENVTVIQVHPLLMPQDIDAITQLLL